MPVKYLADLRNRVNSQQYSSIYEDRRPKIETLKDQMIRRVLKDNKIPGTGAGTRVAEALQPRCRVCCRILGREPGWAV